MKAKVIMICLVGLFASQLLSARGEMAADEMTVAALSSNLDRIEVLLDEGADINAEDSNGTRPLEMVLVMENCPLFRFLLDHGAETDFDCKDGENFQKKIKKTKNRALISILKENGKK